MQSKLAAWRVERNLTQRALSDLSGVSLRTLTRIERREVDNPPIRYLVNLAILLDCTLSDLIEEGWLAWTDFAPDGQRSVGPPVEVGRARL
jgi:transcriptional regulator with XRE-family HTH domain